MKKEDNNKIVYENPTPSCACKVSLDYLGDKWILIIIRDLFRKRHTFTHFFNESSEGIATSVLADRLKKLCKIGVIGFKYLDKNKTLKTQCFQVGGETICEGNYKTAYWTFAQMIKRASDNVTLLPGDILGSGTVGWGSLIENNFSVHRPLEPGDQVELEIEGIGVLSNKVV